MFIDRKEVESVPYLVLRRAEVQLHSAVECGDFRRARGDQRLYENIRRGTKFQAGTGRCSFGFNLKTHSAGLASVLQVWTVPVDAVRMQYNILYHTRYFSLGTCSSPPSFDPRFVGTAIGFSHAWRHAEKETMSDSKPDSPASRRALIGDKYELKEKLGKGNYGDVFLAVDKKTGEKYAAKVLRKKQNWSVEEFQARVMQEVAALQMVRHQNIIQLIDHLRDESEEKFWVIMKLATGQRPFMLQLRPFQAAKLTCMSAGGELMERILKRFHSGRGYTESEVSKIIGDILSACAHMHVRRIVHCDLKPENILYEHSGEDAHLCLVDFGFAQ
eukprot:3304234-Rhodomonas_salina.1